MADISDFGNSARQKITTLDDLAIRVRTAKKAGQKVVYAHGVFDLLHLGHVRHLEAARRNGTYLVVTVTADKFVNKGPGRPVFPENLRAEMLATLIYVDGVAINHTPTAENALQLLQPDVYVKGADYRNTAADVTGKIVAEREVVKSYGGEVIFTDEEAYSSSTLINRHFDVHTPSMRSYLENLRASHDMDNFLSEIEGLKDVKVLVIGDAIIDEYQYVSVLGRPSKETIIATQFMEREVFAGGAIAAANHIAGFCDHVGLITSLGSEDSYEDLIRARLRDNVELSCIVRENAPTTRKCRFVDRGYSLRKLFEVYTMDDTPLAPTAQSALNDLIAEWMKEFDVVIVTDFGHGFLHGSTVELLWRSAPFLAVNAQTNSANHGYNLISKYKRADYVCLDGPEARLAVRSQHSDDEELILRLPSIIDCEKVIVTQGKDGCLTYDKVLHSAGKSGGLRHVPALTSTIVDTVGAGDAFFAVTAPMVYQGLPMSTVGFLGNAAGAMKVSIVGHRSPVERVPYIKFVTTLLK